jgi:hypothetical protein
MHQGAIDVASISVWHTEKYKKIKTQTLNLPPLN